MARLLRGHSQLWSRASPCLLGWFEAGPSHVLTKFGFLVFSQLRLFPLRSRFDTMPSRPSSQALANTTAPSAASCFAEHAVGTRDKPRERLPPRLEGTGYQSAESPAFDEERRDEKGLDSKER